MQNDTLRIICQKTPPCSLQKYQCIRATGKKRCSRMKKTGHWPVAGSILTLSYQCILQLYIMSDLFVFIPLYDLYTWWDIKNVYLP